MINIRKTVTEIMELLYFNTIVVNDSLVANLEVKHDHILRILEDKDVRPKYKVSDFDDSFNLLKTELTDETLDFDLDALLDYIVDLMDVYEIVIK